MTPSAPSERPTDARFSIVIPLRNEEANVQGLIGEIARTLAPRTDYEIVCVDDGSDDATPRLLAELARAHPEVRAFRHAPGRGQSAAIVTGVRRARAPWIVTIDGDGQNDPADVPRLVATLEAARRVCPERAVLVAGRRRRRRDSWLKRLASRVANGIRGWILNDSTADTGCGLKAFVRQDFLELPHFDHLHRFLPALFLRQGGTVVDLEVNHRERQGGRSNYGIFDRLWVGIVDLAGVWWLKRRTCSATVTAIDVTAPSEPTHGSRPSEATR